MLVRVPPKDRNEVRLTLEKKYRITTETHILHATDCGPTWYAGCGIIPSTRPEILRSQPLKAYTYCVYGKPD